MRVIRDDNLLELFKGYLRKLTVGQIILGTCILGLSVWCVINLVAIFRKFTIHDTIISLENEFPNSTDLPGVTICAPSIFKPQVLAKLYPEFARQLYRYDYLKRTRVKDTWDNGAFNTENRNSLLRHYESRAMANFTAQEIIKKLSVRLEDILHGCTYNPLNIRNFQISQRENQNFALNSRKCESIKRVLESIFEGKKCFSFFSALQTDLTVDVVEVDLPQKHSKQFWSLLRGTQNRMVYDLNPSINLNLRAIENDIWHAYVNEPITMTVHPSNILQNRRDFLFFPVHRSNSHEIAFTKKTTLLLEPPAKTMCVKYKESAYFASQGIVTQDQCINNCMINSYSNNFDRNQTSDCANYYSVVTENVGVNRRRPNQTICDHEHQSYNDYLKARASCEDETQCPAECSKSIFEVTGQIRNAINEHCPDWPKLPASIEEERAIALYGKYPDNEADYQLEDEPPVSDNVTLQGHMFHSLPMRQFGPSALPTGRWRQIGGNWTRGRRPNGTDTSTYTFSWLPTIDNPTVCNVRVLIKISPKPFTIVRHQTAMSFESFLGNVGGHLGIWLGLSLYKIMKFTVHILYNLLQKAVRRLSPSFLGPLAPVPPSTAPASMHGHQQ